MVFCIIFAKLIFAFHCTRQPYSSNKTDVLYVQQKNYVGWKYAENVPFYDLFINVAIIFDICSQHTGESFISPIHRSVSFVPVSSFFDFVVIVCNPYLPCFVLNVPYVDHMHALNNRNR